MMHKKSIDILAITESWLDNSWTDNELERNTISFVEIGKQLKVVELLFTLTTHFLLKEGVT